MPKFVAYTEGDSIMVKRDRNNQEKIRSERILNMNLIEFEASSKKDAQRYATQTFKQMERVKLEEKGSTVEASTTVETKDG